MNDRLIDKINNCEIVSFDIFDTLILRKVEKPEDIFIVIEKKYHKKLSTNTSFSILRKEAENSMRQKVWVKYGRNEVTIEEIYSNLNLPSKLKLEIMSFEKELEILFSEKNSYIESVYTYVQKKQKKIILTSDMYLDRETIEAILKKNAYEKYSDLFISSEILKTKASGDLYTYIIDKLNINPEKILHIGDNYNSDIKKAKENGLSTYYYEKSLNIFNNSKLNKKYYDDKLLNSIFKGLLINKYFSHRNHEKFKDTSLEKFGYINVGILYLGFVNWIFEKIKAEKIEKIYFLSRDGYILNEVYKLLKTEKDIESFYMYASRRALNISSIEKITENDIDFLISGTSRIRVKDFLSRIGLSYEKYIEIIKQQGFCDEDQIVDNAEEYSNLRNLFIEISKDIIQISKQERETYLEYLSKIGIFDFKNIGIVDIGWHGTLQKSLNNLINKNFKNKINIHGYYLGTYKKAQDYITKNNNISGYISNMGLPHENLTTLKFSIEIFELIFSASHGSFIKFEKINDKLHAVFENIEVNKFQIEQISKIQKGALDFIGDISELVKSGIITSILPKDAIKNMRIFLETPTYSEALLFGDMEHGEGYGEVYVKRYIAKPEKIFKLLCNPIKAIKSYRNSFWKKGFLKRVFNYRNLF